MPKPAPANQVFLLRPFGFFRAFVPKIDQLPTPRTPRTHSESAPTRSFISIVHGTPQKPWPTPLPFCQANTTLWKRIRPSVLYIALLSAIIVCMASEDLKRQWIALSSPWITEARTGRNANRSGLLDPPMLRACGDVSGLRVLECGCGEGRFCRMLAARGAAYVLGLDLCAPMIEAARELCGDREQYRIADAQDLGFLEYQSFDLAVSYLNQCDLPDFAANTREVYRILRTGGRFIIANLHPMRSAVGAWHKGADGAKQHVIVDRYFDESERRWTMMGVEFTNFHRTLATCLDTFLAAGFALQQIVEPTVTSEQLRAYPELADEQRVPNFIIYVLKRV